MKYHIEYAKYKYGYMTIVGWLVGDTAEADTGLQVQTKKGVPVAAEITRTAREDIRSLFFPGQEENRYGFRIRFMCRLDQQTCLYLWSGSCRAKCKVCPWVIRWTGMIPDNWKEKWKQRIRRVIEKREYNWRQAWDGAINLYDCRENPYREAMKFDPPRPWEKWDPPAAPALFSILVPLYRTNREHLLELLESVQTQSYKVWELCLADGSPESILEDCEAKAADPENQIEKRIVEILHDPRVKYRYLKQNMGISGNTNAGLELVTGEYVVMADHDDVMTPDALWTVAEWIRENPEVDFLYSDSDLTDQDHFYNYNPLYKPGWSPEMLYSANYITHLSIVRTSLLRRLGGFRQAYDGAQDWDLFLRIGEATKRIGVIPRILYHWRAAAGSTALTVEEKPYARLAQLKTVQDHLDRIGIPGHAEFADEHSTCIRVNFSHAQRREGQDGCEEKSSEERDRAGKLGSRKPAAVHIVTAPGIEISPEAEEELCAWARVPGIGIVGVRVRDGSGKIRSQGLLLQSSASGTVLYAGKEPGIADAIGHTDWYRNDLVPDTACYAVSDVVADAIGMPDAGGGNAAMTEWFLKMKKAGYRSLITPFVEVFVEAS